MSNTRKVWIHHLLRLNKNRPSWPTAMLIDPPAGRGSGSSTDGSLFDKTRSWYRRSLRDDLNDDSVGIDKIDGWCWVASEFARYSSPGQNHQSASFNASRLLALFLRLDDSEDVGMFDARRERGMAAFLEWSEEVFTAEPKHEDRFMRCWKDYLRAQKEELGTSEVDLQEHCRIRRETTFVKPYAWCWMESLGLSGEHVPEQADELLEKASDLVIWANDIASYARDSDGSELNLAVEVARTIGSMTGGLDLMVEWYNGLARTFISGTPGTFEKILVATVNGNIAGTKSLAEEMARKRSEKVVHLRKVVRQRPASVDEILGMLEDLRGPKNRYEHEYLGLLDKIVLPNQ